MTPLVVLFCAFAFSVFLIVAGIATIRFWRRRDNRRSPLHGKKVHNVAGQQLVARIGDHGDGMLMAATVMYFSLPVVLLAWAVVRVPWSEITFGFVEGLYVFAGLSLFAWGLRDFIRHGNARQRAQDGLVAERMTAQQLNRLSGPNCVVMHDIPCGKFNIDHVLVGPHGVYAIETKSIRKKGSSADDRHYKVGYDGDVLAFPGWRTSEPLDQARAQAQWLGRYLRESMGVDIRVIPAVALPGWWIDRTQSAARSDVRVLTPMGRGADFMIAGPELIDARSRQLIVQALGMRFPEVEDV